MLMFLCKRLVNGSLCLLLHQWKKETVLRLLFKWVSIILTTGWRLNVVRSDCALVILTTPFQLYSSLSLSYKPLLRVPNAAPLSPPPSPYTHTHTHHPEPILAPRCEAVAGDRCDREAELPQVWRTWHLDFLGRMTSFFASISIKIQHGSIMWWAIMCNSIWQLLFRKWLLELPQLGHCFHCNIHSLSAQIIW